MGVRSLRTPSTRVSRSWTRKTGVVLTFGTKSRAMFCLLRFFFFFPIEVALRWNRPAWRQETQGVQYRHRLGQGALRGEHQGRPGYQTGHRTTLRHLRHAVVAQSRERPGCTRRTPHPLLEAQTRIPSPPGATLPHPAHSGTLPCHHVSPHQVTLAAGPKDSACPGPRPPVGPGSRGARGEPS